jgi:hypothetical protein
MAKNFEDFLKQPDTSAKKTSYQDFAEKVWTVTPANETPAIDVQSLDNQPSASLPKLDLSATLQQLKDLSGTIGDAMKGSRTAIAAITEDFKVKNEVQKVVLPKELINFYAEKEGVKPDDFNIKSLKFGVQTITSDEQYAKLKNDVNRLRRDYHSFNDAEIHLVTQKDGSKVAVVMGVDANEFNSVIAAERTKEQLEQSVKTALIKEKTPEKEKEKTADAGLGTMKDKVAELQAKYPKTAKEPAVASLSEHELQKPTTSLPGQQKSNVREVA